jgi:uncharacterized protein (DUF58 family)
MTSRSMLAPPAARQGPGPVPSRLIKAMDLSLVRRAAGLLPGDQRAPGAGAGTELAQLRPYQPGDDVRQLDPAATARTGVPHVRLQVPERLMTAWILLDLSPSMAFGTADRLKSDVAEGVAGVVGRLATRRGGRVGLLTCGGPESRLLPPRSGRGANVAIGRVLAEGVTADGHGDDHGLEHGLSQLGRIARRPSFVAVISDFRGPLGWRGPLRALAGRHSLAAIEVRDPREASLPSVGRLSLVDPESGRLLEVDTSNPKLRERFEQRESADRNAVRDQLRHAGAKHVVLSTRGAWLETLVRGLQ